MQFLIIGFTDEHAVIIEKMDFLLIAHADVGMPVQKIVQRRCAGFLGAGEDETKPFNFATLGPKHRCNVTEISLVVVILFREAPGVRTLLASPLQ